MGLYRVDRSARGIKRRFPHRRGGVRNPATNKKSPQAFSPQAWGCTRGHLIHVRVSSVFPTGVGVYLPRLTLEGYQARFPHRRGGVPPVLAGVRLVAEFSPQAWGCTAAHSRAKGGLPVFPTGVGVYRDGVRSHVEEASFPHRRGGVPGALGKVSSPGNRSFCCPIPGESPHLNLFSTPSGSSPLPL